jgi:class 3 adenylate cyclase
MTAEGYKRKLTAILSADVKGYSRLMGEDEEATIRTLTAYREVIDNLIRKHRGWGRFFTLRGDQRKPLLW